MTVIGSTPYDVYKLKRSEKMLEFDGYTSVF